MTQSLMIVLIIISSVLFVVITFNLIGVLLLKKMISINILKPRSEKRIRKHSSITIVDCEWFNFPFNLRKSYSLQEKLIENSEYIQKVNINESITATIRVLGHLFCWDLFHTWVQDQELLFVFYSFPHPRLLELTQALTHFLWVWFEFIACYVRQGHLRWLSNISFLL